ncbi:ABC transporter ATP-binding protein [Teichococcus vastitatis]|uniref:ABC transporter ATP-binding protein n=1 Tax=Teichococcus vastitatis TaxID=2307076 RepID=A0ABS9W9E7_9PROT|nr:ABC transporter ATP-binding protein [Pseudoroseomonas vastitatis]
MTIAARNVGWSAGGRMVLDGVTLEAAPGQVLGLIGPNGSGKSSLLRLLAGLRRVASGVVTLDGRNIDRCPRGALARRVAMVEQQAATEAPVTVLDVVRLGRVPHRGLFSSWNAPDAALVDQVLCHVGLHALRHRLWHTLSGGERQRAQIARALAQHPQELLLDEPTNHLDVQHQLEILALIRRLPVTTVVALHDLNLAAMFCDNLVLLQNGRVRTAGAPADVLTRQRLLEVFGVSAHLGISPHHGRLHIQFLPPQPR